MIRIRNYLASDYEQVKTLLREANLFDETWDSEENLAGMVQGDQDAILVAVDEDTVIGNVYIVPFGPKVANLYRLVVKKLYRNQGVATKLLEQAEIVARKRGMVEVDLFVDSEDKELHTFYTKRMFKPSQKSYIDMWKELKSIL